MVIVTANVPISGFQKAVHATDDKILAATGARQVWSVFAPDPQQVVSSLGVRFVYRDGTSSTWRLRRGGALVGGYSDYRWLKLGDNAVRSDLAASGLLLWAVRAHAGPKPLVRAELVRSVYDIARPGDPRGRHGAPGSGALLTLTGAG